MVAQIGFSSDSLKNIEYKNNREVERILQARYGDSIAMWIMAQMPAPYSLHKAA